MLNDGVYWDGPRLVHAFDLQNYESIRTWFYEASLPPVAWLNYLFMRSPFPDETAKLFSAICVLPIGLVIYYTAKNYTRLAPLESWFLAAFAIAYPPFNTLVSIVLTAYIPFLSMFYIAWLLYFEGKNKGNRSLIAIGIPLLFLSLTYNSLLIYHLAFCALLFIYEKKKISKFIFDHWMILILPFVFYAIKKIVYPPYGMYAPYNHIKLDFYTVKAFVKFLWVIFGLQSYEALLSFFSHWLWLLSAGLIGILFWRFLPKQNSVSTFKPKAFLLVFSILFLGSSLPYILVGKAPALHYWDERHAFLMGLCLATAIIFTNQFLCERLPGFVKVSKGFLLLILLAYVSLINRDYVLWEAQDAKNKSITAFFQDREPPPDGTFLIYDDQYQIQPEAYMPYEVNYFLYEAWKKETWASGYSRFADMEYGKILNGEALFPKQYYANYVMKDFKPNGCRQTFTISQPKNRKESDFNLGWNYLSKRFFHPDRLNEFLKSVLDIRVDTIACQKVSESTNTSHREF